MLQNQQTKRWFIELIKKEEKIEKGERMVNTERQRIFSFFSILCLGI